MKNVDIVALGATLKQELDFCKKNGIKDPLQHMTDSWYVDYARIERIEGYPILCARYAYKFLYTVIDIKDGYYVASDIEIEGNAVITKTFRSKDLKTLIIGLLIYFKMSI